MGDDSGLLGTRQWNFRSHKCGLMGELIGFLDQQSNYELLKKDFATLHQ
jgi:hypothetical protein